MKARSVTWVEEVQTRIGTIITLTKNVPAAIMAVDPMVALKAIREQAHEALTAIPEESEMEYLLRWIRIQKDFNRYESGVVSGMALVEREIHNLGYYEFEG